MREGGGGCEAGQKWQAENLPGGGNLRRGAANIPGCKKTGKKKRQKKKSGVGGWKLER